jgi:O-antigen/teichoic acid export membrane protein
MTMLRRSLAYSALDSYLGLVLQLASTVIIARILTPEQVGSFAVAAAFAALASTFRDFGIAEYLIQEQQLDNTALRAALSVNIGTSWLVALVLMGLAPAAADFYRSPVVADVMRVQALSFVLIPFGAVTMAWFRRQMDFRPVFLSGIAANLTSFVVSVALAMSGQGAMSLAWASLAGVAVTVAVSIAMRPKGMPWRPGWAGVGRVIHFGKFASGVYLFGQLGKGAPEMVIGRALDVIAVGVFSRASGLVEIFNRLVLRAVTPVYLPFFAKSLREHGSSRQGLLMAMSFTSVVGWPFLACTALYAYAAIRLMYGPQWLQAVPLAPWLCAVAAIELVYASAKEALLAQGLAKEANQLQVGIQGLRLAGLLAVIPFGLQGACWGLLLSATLGACLSHRALRKHTALTLKDIAGVLWPSLQVTLVTTLPLAGAAWAFPTNESNYLVSAMAGGAACGVLWLLGLWRLQHAMAPELHRLLIAAAARLPWQRQR